MPELLQRPPVFVYWNLDGERHRAAFFISLFAEASRKLLSKSFARSNKARKVSLEVVGFVPLQFKWIDAVQTILNCGNWIVDQYRALPASINKHSKLLENFQPDFAAFLPVIFHRNHSTRWYKLSQFRKSWQISTRKSSFESQPQTTTRTVKLGSILHPTPHSRRRPTAKQEFGIKTTHTHNNLFDEMHRQKLEPPPRHMSTGRGKQQHQQPPTWWAMISVSNSGAGVWHELWAEVEDAWEVQC